LDWALILEKKMETWENARTELKAESGAWGSKKDLSQKWAKEGKV